jgi:hypothetical protein
MYLNILQQFIVKFLLDILFFPFWWYTVGAKRVLLKLFDWLRQGNIDMSPGLWLSNIFVPMFGQRDFQGRLASFFIRFWNVIFRSIGLLFWFIILIFLFMIWLAFPVFVVYMFYRSIL